MLLIDLNFREHHSCSPDFLYIFQSETPFSASNLLSAANPRSDHGFLVISPGSEFPMIRPGYPLAIGPIMPPLARSLVIAFIFTAVFAHGARAAFDADRAARLIREQCDLGPRIPGTPAHDKCREWIGRQLRELGMTVQFQDFETSLPLTGQKARASNIWGLPSADGPTSPALIISAHWDTRPFADQDPSGTNPPMLGANDGAAGVAFALEFYRSLADAPLLRRHIVVVFWDAEDAGITGGNEATWALGARYAAAHQPAWIKRVALGINIDMPAGADLSLKRETFSMKSAPWAVDEIWRIGLDLQPRRFSNEELATSDDHRPWIDAGVPYIDLIGWPYQHWHTAADTPEHCDPKSMRALAEVLDHYIRHGRWNRGAKPIF